MSALLGKIFSKKDGDKVSVAKTPRAKKVSSSIVESKEEPVIEVSKKKSSKKKDAGAHKILLRPLITEKATAVGIFNKYEFVVSDDATKPRINEAVRNVYGVEPVKVNIVRVLGKKVRHGRRSGKTKDWKKAIVTLKQGDRIEIYEGV
jgi:large subunit ribosomal protein L23